MGHPSEIFDVSGKVILVTGGSHGLGLQMVSLLVRAGAKVVSAARTHDEAASAEIAASAAPDCAPMFLPVDITQESDISRVFHEAEKVFGLVEVLVNNAGVSEKRRAGEITRKDWQALMAVNVDAQLFMAIEAARRMTGAGAAGSIINITSILAERPLKGTAAYSVSKAALTQLTRALAVEWAPFGIRVNAIAPGWFPTQMNADFLGGPGGSFIRGINPMRRLGEAGDLDGAVLLLASAASRYMTGTVLTVDGGQSLVS